MQRHKRLAPANKSTKEYPVLLSPHALTQPGMESGANGRFTLPLAGYDAVNVQAHQESLIYDGLLNTQCGIFPFPEPYLRAIFGFVGITDMHFVNAQPFDISPQLREMALSTGIEAARQLVDEVDFADSMTISPH